MGTKRVGTRRKFGGKYYYVVHTEHRKVDAIKAAYKLRRRGFLARVTKRETKEGSWYLIWANAKVGRR